VNTQDILMLYDYNYWVTRRVLAAAAQVSHEQFISPTGHSFGSLRGTLVHMLDGEGDYRERVLWHCLLHLANHGTQHCSEAAAILTGYGRSPGYLDFTAFLNER
jgi:uncharacterized damage-inducible protein DinB